MLDEKAKQGKILVKSNFHWFSLLIGQSEHRKLSINGPPLVYKR